MPLNLGADNEKSIERKGEIIDKNETAVCSEFAAAAANILKGKGANGVFGLSIKAMKILILMTNKPNKD